MLKLWYSLSHPHPLSLPAELLEPRRMRLVHTSLRLSPFLDGELHQSTAGRRREQLWWDEIKPSQILQSRWRNRRMMAPCQKQIECHAFDCQCHSNAIFCPRVCVHISDKRDKSLKQGCCCRTAGYLARKVIHTVPIHTETHTLRDSLILSPSIMISFDSLNNVMQNFLICYTYYILSYAYVLPFCALLFFFFFFQSGVYSM